MSRACLITLLAVAAISCAAASRILEDDAAAMGRQLLQSANRYVCSSHCVANQCIRVGTTGLTKCNKCKNNMKPILAGVNAGQCGCPAGTYFDPALPASGGDGPGNCIPCEFGYYCNKQLTWVPNNRATTMGRTACDAHLTTRARRSTSVWDCVNMGGYYQNNTATGPAAQACTGNTYAIAKSKQSACTPCPAGMQVNETDARDKPTSCKVPPGYFMKSPGQIAPCDQGSYQPLALTADQAAAGSCIACTEGVTTVDKASDALADCNLLKPGYVATALGGGGDIANAVLCPQGYYCAGSAAGGSAVTAYVEISELTQAIVTGGTFIATVAPKPNGKTTDEALIKQCTNSAWTKNVGATAVDQCMVPPGFEISGGTVAPCGDYKYRSDWISLAAASGKACVDCGAGIKAEAIEPITLYSLNTTVEAGANTDYSVLSALVKASSKSCYIVQGQGMYYVANGTSMVYRARNCGAGATPVANSYGVSGEKVYGLAQTPCKLCPAGMKADTTLTDTDVPDYSTYKAANGFFNPLACVTVAGYGYDGRVATLCAKGWYNAGNNYLACTQCGYGLTTEAAGKTTSTDCLSAPGFGYYNGTTWLAQDGKMQQCPAGTYNNETRTPVECTACPGNSWTEEEGSDAAADCTICKPGFGGADTGACVACGGNDAAGSYGPPGRDDTELSCVACPTSVVGFQFWYEGDNKNYTSPARAVAGAQDAADCVSAMAQIEDGLWYLAGAADASATDKTSIQDCADYCLGVPLCMFATFDYAATLDADKCKVKTTTNAGTAVITAFKAVPSSDVSQSRKLQAAKPKAVSTGMYTQWLDTGSGIGDQNPSVPDAGTKAACFDACDALDSCAGVVFDDAQDNVASKKCLLMTGVTAPDGANVAKRSLTRAKPSLFAI